MVTATKPVASHNQFFETELPGLRNFRPFGEMAIVNYHHNRKTCGKVTDRGRACLLLGRAKDHNTDVHRFLNLTTRKVITSRDVLWLNKTYGVWKGIGQPTHVEPESDEDEELLDPQRRVTRATNLRENHTEFIPISPPLMTPLWRTLERRCSPPYLPKTGNGHEAARRVVQSRSGRL